MSKKAAANNPPTPTLPHKGGGRYALLTIDAVGVEIAGGVSLVDVAVGDRGRAEDHRHPRFDDGTVEQDRPIGSGHDGGEGAIAYGEDAAGRADGTEHRSLGSDFPERPRQIVGAVGGDAAGHRLPVDGGPAAGDIERMTVEG